MLAAVAALALFQTGFVGGATLRIYDIGQPMDELYPLVAGQTPNIDRLIDRIDIKEGEFGLKDHFVADVTAEFHAVADGDYEFQLSSDDGSVLLLDGKQVVDNNGIHPATPVKGRAHLTAGWHPMVIHFFEHEGQESLKLEWRNGSGDFVVADKSVLRVANDITRVTSPGQKAVIGVGGKRRPGNGMPLSGLNPGWNLWTVRPDDFKPQVGAMAFLPDGRLLVTNFKPNQSGGFLPDLRDGTIYLLDGVTGTDRKKITVKKVAESVQEPLGLCVVKDANIPKGYHVYLSQRTEITELIDTNNDDVFDQMKTVAKAWDAVNYHHFCFGLAEKDGFLYASLSTSITSGAPGINGPNPPNRGTVMKIDPLAYNPSMPMANVEFISGGHRTPNGIEVGPEGLLLVGENQGAWQPANKINVVEPGGFYGHYNNTEFKTPDFPNGGVPGPFDEQPLEAPALYLPQNECANSPAQSVVMPNGPFSGQLLISDVKYGGLRRGFLEKVDGVWQGGVVQFSQGFEVGTNRMVWGPDGALYIGGIGATETWAWTDPKTGKWTTYGLQKIKPNGKVAFEIQSVKATTNGFDVTFTHPIGSVKPDQIIVKQWDYQPTPEYGGDKKHRETLVVSKVEAKDDHSIHLTIPGLKEHRVVYLNLGNKSKRGEALYATECWYTLNRMPRPALGLNTSLVNPNPRLLVFSKTAGFRHDSIPAGIEAIKRLGAKRGFTADFTEDASAFTPDNLKRYDAIVFLSTTGNILDESQEAAMKGFIEAGGGFVGIHAATDTEDDWQWYRQLIGGHFKRHPAIQQARIVIEDRAHPTTAFLPNNWRRVDEWYDFRINPRSHVRVLASLDNTSYQGSEMGDDHPIIWSNEFDGGRVWYTELGHTQASYHEELFLKSLAEGIFWVCQAKTPTDAQTPTWTSEQGWSKTADGFWNNERGPNIVSQQQMSDVQVHAEFRIPKGSNSGVYLMGRYEVQILDSFGKPLNALEFSDCGGIYQRFIEKTQFGYEGTPPMRNAERAPGEWNTYDILFRAPRFDAKGKKTENARFVEVRLNGVIVQSGVEVTGPTRAAMFEDEQPTGPLMLQGDHGPITYRNVWFRPVK